ncbi:hypothetical protein [Pseudoalteromonas sp. NBT06-2]|uniref:hypothetical protein n=1 Tax=Pseudoalteromonas sp. NBT06-2 TaxID=2025950 RepID=UPI0011410B62|nr:hypothetical protein [Pseudoalteromonas sp. NBT06-2]
MNTIIAVCTTVFILLIGIIIRQAVKIGTLESSLKNENKSIDGLIAKLDISVQKHEETISSIKKEHADIVNELNHKIKVLENKNKIDVSKIPAKKVHHW